MPDIDIEQRVQSMFLRWGAGGGFALLLGFVAQGLFLTWQVQGLEPRMKVLESRLERSILQIDGLDDKVEAIGNDVTRLSTQIEMRN